MDGPYDDRETWLEFPPRAEPVRTDARLDLERWVRRVPRPQDKILVDFGAGLGGRLPLVASRFSRAVAADGWDEWRGRVDVVIAIDTLPRERLADFDRALGDVRASLVDGGMLLAAFPAAPKATILRAMLLDGGADTRCPEAFHEIELQYRLQRAGLRGTVIRRAAAPDGGERLVCRAVRRGDN